MRAQAQAIEPAQTEAYDDQVVIATAHAHQRLFEAIDGRNLIGRRQRGVEPCHRLRPILDDEDTARRVVVDQGLRRIDQAHALPRRLAHAQFVGHQLQAYQAAHAGEQRRIVHRLGKEIVGARIEPGDAVAGLVQRGHHHHRDMGRLGIALDAAGDFKTVHARHHHVEQNDVGVALFHFGERFNAVERGDDLEIFGRQLRFEQLYVR